jgi:hypothetical protein
MHQKQPPAKVAFSNFPRTAPEVSFELPALNSAEYAQDNEPNHDYHGNFHHIFLLQMEKRELTTPFFQKIAERARRIH